MDLQEEADEASEETDDQTLFNMVLDQMKSEVIEQGLDHPPEGKLVFVNFLHGWRRMSTPPPPPTM